MDVDLKTEPDLSLLLDSAARCRLNEDSVATDHYLCVMSELARLLYKFHKGLPVVYNSGQSPLRSLQIHRVSGARCYYSNLNMMVQYEVQHNLLKGTSSRCSGTVALLDLNRVLGFIIEFLQILHQRAVVGSKFPAKERLNVYVKTLSPHHTALTRATCRLAVTRCHGRRHMLSILIACCHGDQQPITVLGDILVHLRHVHAAVNHILSSTQN